MAGEFDQQIDIKQKELKGQESQTEKQTLAEAIKDHESILFGEIDNFQQLDQTLNLKTNKAKEYLDRGKKDVLAFLIKIAANGKAVLDSKKIPADANKAKGELNAADVESINITEIHDQSHSLANVMREYRADLDKMAQYDKPWHESSQQMLSVWEMESSAEVINAAPNIPEPMLAKYKQALKPLCNLQQAIDLAHADNLPKDYVSRLNTVLEQKVPDLMKNIQSKVTFAEQQKLVLNQYINLVTLKKDKSGKLEAILSSEGEKLTPEKQKEMLMNISGVGVLVDQEMREATAPKPLQTFFNAKKLFEAGDFEGAKKLFTQFKEHDIYDLHGTSASGRKEAYGIETDQYLKQIEGLLDKNKELFEAQKLLAAGKFYEAKALLKKFIADNEKTDGAFINSANALLLNINAAQFEDVKAHFDQIKAPDATYLYNPTPGYGGYGSEIKDNPDYPGWKKYGEALVKIQNEIKAGKDFQDLYKQYLQPLEDSLKNVGPASKDCFNAGSDQFILETKGRAGMLELAKKYRDDKNYQLAEKYFSMYFGQKLLEGEKQPEITFDSIKQQYGGRLRSALAAREKVDAAKEAYDQEAAKDPNYAKAHPWDEAKVYHAMEDEYLQGVWKEALINAKNGKYIRDPESFSKDPTERAAWGEYMNFKGKYWQGTWAENFALSDETRDRLIREIPIQIALIAISGGVASMARAAATVAIEEAVASGAARSLLGLGMASADAAIYARGAGMLGAQVIGLAAIEAPVFVMTESTLGGMMTGKFKVTNLTEFYHEWQSAVLTMGALNAAGAMSRELSIAKSLREVPGAAQLSGVKGAAIKAFDGAVGFGTEMTTMGIINGGQLKIDDFAMVLGLKIGHSAVEIPVKIDKAMRESNLKRIESLKTELAANNNAINDLEWQIATAKAKGESTGTLEKNLADLNAQSRSADKALVRKVKSEINHQLSDARADLLLIDQQIRKEKANGKDTQALEVQRSESQKYIDALNQQLTSLDNNVTDPSVSKKHAEKTQPIESQNISPNSLMLEPRSLIPTFKTLSETPSFTKNPKTFAEDRGQKLSELDDPFGEATGQHQQEYHSVEKSIETIINLAGQYDPVSAEIHRLMSDKQISYEDAKGELLKSKPELKTVVDNFEKSWDTLSTAYDHEAQGIISRIASPEHRFAIERAMNNKKELSLSILRSQKNIESLTAEESANNPQLANNINKYKTLLKTGKSAEAKVFFDNQSPRAQEILRYHDEEFRLENECETVNIATVADALAQSLEYSESNTEISKKIDLINGQQSVYPKGKQQVVASNGPRSIVLDPFGKFHLVVSTPMQLDQILAEAGNKRTKTNPEAIANLEAGIRQNIISGKLTVENLQQLYQSGKLTLNEGMISTIVESLSPNGVELLASSGIEISPNRQNYILKLATYRYSHTREAAPGAKNNQAKNDTDYLASAIRLIESGKINSADPEVKAELSKFADNIIFDSRFSTLAYENLSALCLAMENGHVPLTNGYIDALLTSIDGAKAIESAIQDPNHKMVFADGLTAEKVQERINFYLETAQHLEDFRAQRANKSLDIKTESQSAFTSIDSGKIPNSPLGNLFLSLKRTSPELYELVKKSDIARLEKENTLDAILSGQKVSFENINGQRVVAFVGKELGVGGLNAVHCAAYIDPIDGSLKFGALRRPYKAGRDFVEPEMQAAALVDSWNSNALAKPLEIGLGYTIMETAPKAVDLYKGINEKALPAEVRWEGIRQTVHAIKEYQKRGYIHGDLKESNVLVFVNEGPNGTEYSVKVIDNNPTYKSRIMEADWAKTRTYTKEADELLKDQQNLTGMGINKAKSVDYIFRGYDPYALKVMLINTINSVDPHLLQTPKVKAFIKSFDDPFILGSPGFLGEIMGFVDEMSQYKEVNANIPIDPLVTVRNNLAVGQN